MLTEFGEELAACDDKQYEQVLSGMKEDLAQKQAAAGKHSAAASAGQKARAADPNTGYGKGIKLDTFADKNRLPWASSQDPPNDDRFHFVVREKGPSDQYDKLWCVTCEKWITSFERSRHQLRHWPHGKGAKAVAARKAETQTNKITSFFKKNAL